MTARESSSWVSDTQQSACLWYNVPCRLFVPDADGVIVVGFHRDVFRQGEVVQVVAAVFFFVPDAGDEDADDEGREADESQAHLPGEGEEAFEGSIHLFVFIN